MKFAIHTTGASVVCQAEGSAVTYLTRENLQLIVRMLTEKPDYVQGLIEALPDKNGRKVAKAKALLEANGINVA